MSGAATSRRPSAGSWCWALRSGTPARRAASPPGPPVHLLPVPNRHCTRGSTTRPFGKHSKNVFWGRTTGRGAAGLAARIAASCSWRTRLAVSGADGPGGILGSMDGRAPRHAVLPGAADRCLAALEQSTDGTIPCLREAAATKNLLQREGWEACPGWHAAYEGARPARANGLTAPVHATRTRNLHYRDRVLLPALQPSSRALLRSQGGAHADAWLSAVPSEPALTLAPQAMQLALRRRLRLPLPLSPNRCCPSPGCGQQVDEWGCCLAERKSSSGPGCA